MCVVAIAWQAHPRWRLIVAGNRDEFHARPTAALARWRDAPHLLAGRDLQSGGSWLGVSEQGRVATVTNLTGFGDPQPDRASRGALIADYLSGTGRYATLETGDLGDFNPFNLFVAAGNRADFLTNGPVPVRLALSPGVHSLSNGQPALQWPRKQQLHTALTNWMAKDADQPELLFAALRDEAVLGDDTVRPVFINGPEYGTRCSSVIAVDQHGQALFTERRFGPNGIATGETTLGFFWPDLESNKR
jgi:uncharacterized protein with NRDE domain